MSDTAIFSKRMREARNRKGLKQKELAEKIGVKAQAISSYETLGKLPTMENGILIAKTLGVSLDWLCGLDEKVPIEKFKSTGGIIRSILEVIQETGAFVLINQDDSTLPNAGKAELHFKDAIIANFLSEWDKIHRLLLDKTIDEKFYQMWLDDKLKAIDTLEIET